MFSSTLSDLELTTTVGRWRDLKPEALASYDAVYLGDPFCDLGVDNLLERADDLRRAITLVKELGKRVYLSTYVEPWSEKAPALQETIDTAVSAGVDAVEVFDLGVMHMMSEGFPAVNIHLGNFVRIFNPQSLAVFEKYRITRIIPNPELSLQDIEELRASGTVSIELQVHGKIPLGYTERCALLPEKTTQRTPCQGECYGTYRLVHATGLSMRPCGRVTFSAKDLCMLRHMGQLLQKGYRHFRIESRFESDTYRFEVGRAYRQYLQKLMESESALVALNADGLCNGYYFERPGMAYL